MKKFITTLSLLTLAAVLQAQTTSPGAPATGAPGATPVPRSPTPMLPNQQQQGRPFGQPGANGNSGGNNNNNNNNNNIPATETNSLPNNNLPNGSSQPPVPNTQPPVPNSQPPVPAPNMPPAVGNNMNIQPGFQSVQGQFQGGVQNAGLQNQSAIQPGVSQTPIPTNSFGFRTNIPGFFNTNGVPRTNGF